jgi:hypothetical protein
MKEGADTAEDRGGIGVRTFNRIVRKRAREDSGCLAGAMNHEVGQRD